MGRHRRQRPRIGAVQLPGPERACRGCAVARPQRARRRRAHGRRLELPPRASAPAAALALRDSQRRRSAQRRAADRLGLVLPARARLCPHPGAVRAGRYHRHAAAMMTSTTELPPRILGSAWPGHFNRVIAEAMYENIKQIGLPEWSEADQRLAHALQREIGAPDSGLATKLDTLRPALKPNERTGGGSDDIGDVSWNVPTVTLRFPSNIPGLPGHNWANAISMATPIAHKGATAGAKVMAMTVLDLLMRPELVTQAWDYFRNVQTKDIKYQPLIRPQDRPAIELNRDVMARFRPQMRRFYYDPTKYRTYLEQLGITYPTERAADGSCAGGATP